MANREGERLPAVPEDRVEQEVALSLFIPGLGQLAQGRRLAAATQFGTVVGYLIAAWVGLGGRAWLIAIAWNVWSAVDAYRHAQD